MQKTFRPVGAGTTVFDPDEYHERVEPQSKAYTHLHRSFTSSSTQTSFEQEQKPLFVQKVSQTRNLASAQTSYQHTQVKQAEHDIEEDPLLAARREIEKVLGKINTTSPRTPESTSPSTIPFQQTFNQKILPATDEFCIDLPLDYRTASIGASTNASSPSSSLLLVNVDYMDNGYSYMAFPEEEDSPVDELESALFRKHRISMKIPILKNVTRYLFYRRKEYFSQDIAIKDECVKERKYKRKIRV